MAAFYTNTNAIAQIRRLLNEPTARLWSATELGRWLDMGARQFSALSLCKFVTQDITLATATMEYAIGTPDNNFVKVESAVYNKVTTTTPTGVGLQRVDLRVIGNEGSATNAAPRKYAIWADNIYVWPTPGDTSDTGSGVTVTVTGYSMVGGYGADASETLPDVVQPHAITYALSCAWAKVGKHQKSGMYMQQFLSAVQEYRQMVYDKLGQIDSIQDTKTPDYTQVIS